MSFTGIFKAKNGIVAVVDSKASRVENGQSYEDVHRNPEKLFVFQNGIATTFGANQILVQNPFEFSSKVIAIEDLVYEYLHLKNILDASFFQSLLVKMTSNPANTEPVNFLVGRKIRQEEYIFDNLPYLSQITSVDVLQKTVAKELDGLIQYYDQQSEYNPVGKPVKSYVLR